jgi:hypothetical protein
MLTQIIYNDLWTINLGQPLLEIPCYYQYLQREVYFQDYLDLFCCPKNGKPTYERIVVQGRQTVSIQSLQADPHGVYTFNDSSGNLRLIVDYDFPYDNKELCKGRKIRYILIGEAAHAESTTYFYNVIHTKHTPYFSQPVNALGVVSKQVNKVLKKQEELFSLAQNGVLLIDLLPFNANYSQFVYLGGSKSSIRKALCNNGTINFFWDNSKNLYSILNRLNRIAGCLNNNWDLSLMAPSDLSVFLINLKPLNIVPNGLHPINFKSIGQNVLRCIKGRDYLKITINSSNQGPSACLIRNSFGLIF